MVEVENQKDDRAVLVRIPPYTSTASFFQGHGINQAKLWLAKALAAPSELRRETKTKLQCKKPKGRFLEAASQGRAETFSLHMVNVLTPSTVTLVAGILD
jgi:hypothetical protein